MPSRQALVDMRVWRITGLALLLSIVCVLAAMTLIALIGLVTNLAFYGTLSTQTVSPAGHRLGMWVVLVPVVGGVIVGLMARYGAASIRGHGIPEAMEQILTNESRIPLRLTFLKPLSAAVAIGTGGPFGAEGPIIATGGSLGSALGQALSVTASERKTLLAAGAAAGMTAIFNAPVAAVLLAIELLLFEFKPRSLIPVALAASCAAAFRQWAMGAGPVFAMPSVPMPEVGALPGYVLIGALVGLVSVGVTKSVYWVEDAFARLPVHWMWWPAIGGLVVGLVGHAFPRTLGVGYDNIEMIIGGHWAVPALLALMLAKFLSWSIALGSGTSGGTLAPLFTIGGALGGLLAVGLAHLGIASGALHVHPGVAALVGMAAMFSGASRAMLTSAVFALETTGQASALGPLLCGCVGAYAVSCLTMRTTIMTEKIMRRGVRVPAEYSADPLAQLSVAQACTRPAFMLPARAQVGALREWMNSQGTHTDHQGYPVVDETESLCGVVTRRDVFNPAVPADTALGQLIKRPPIAVALTDSLRDAADHMVAENVGRLVVVDKARPDQVLGILTRGDLLASQSGHVRQSREARRHWSPFKGVREKTAP
ncbi:MAG: chloride channel protein [Aquabacterium sp.]